MPEHQLFYLDIDLLEPNPLQARGLIRPDSLAELVSSIREHGILEPIVVAKTPAGYQIIAGERRWRASKIVGLTKVPVAVKETTSQGMLELAIVENVQREDLNPIERALAFQRLIEEFGMTLGPIAERVGKSESYVSNSIRLLSLPDAVKDGLISGAISEGHARAIAGLADTKLMVDAYKTILSENSSVRAAEELARKIKSKSNFVPTKRLEKIHSDEMQEFQEKLAQKLDADVQITQSKVRARAIITFTGSIEKTTKQMREMAEKLIG